MAFNKVLVFSAFVLVAVSGKCLKNCNITLSYCQENPIVEQTICQGGMDSCVNRCAQNSTFLELPVNSSKCIELAEYLPETYNDTQHRLFTDCMYKAFQPKNNSNNSHACTENFDDASLLCKYT